MGDGGSVLVVGASRGIGLELVRQYAADGWSVHATTRSPQEPGALAAIEGAVQIHSLDVRDRNQTAALIDSLPEHGLSVAIHNAGIYRGHTREEMMEINGKAPLVVAQGLIDRNRLARNGKLILMTSQMGARRGRSGSLGDY